MEPPFMIKLMASSVSIATVAGSIIRRILSSGKLGIVDKGVNDLQTQADRSVQHCIVTSLSKKFPGICIIGEEDLGNNEQPYSELVEDTDPSVLAKNCPKGLESTTVDDVVVWVDPLDGTNEFAQGVLEHVTILIGVSVQGRAVGGVVCQPFYMADFRGFIENAGEQERHPRVEETHQRLIWGLEGLGVFGLAGEPIAKAPVFSPTTGDERANCIVCTRSHSTPTAAAAIESCAPSKVYRLGGCGFKMLMLLEGVAHAYVYASTGCKRWDTCAPEALINAIGGRVSGVDGQSYSYAGNVQPIDARGVVATPTAAWHSAYIARIPQSVVDSLCASAPYNE
ncbi:3'2'5' bisphosphate nucleotidase 1 [Echinococcus multilocularis]|uniref:3'(2'),5'-bisphosphate nucleotidase 1 n=1 Tax=Echinococcus multilocularis TaxID=6211 RepID=A0A068Y375_ECHMU|nr:3'2'5' bisphosphate nucleotidase 1 [Echinococcus multilocularis]